MSKLKIYYRASLIAEEEGLTVLFEKWKPFRESECYAWCCDEYSHKTAVDICSSSNSPIKDVKASIRVKRIDKNNSRFAQETHQLALDGLRYRKKCQIKHLERELEFAKAFLAQNDEDLKLEPVNADFSWNDSMKVSGTYDLVHSHFVFD